MFKFEISVSTKFAVLSADMKWEAKGEASPLVAGCSRRTLAHQMNRNGNENSTKVP